MKAKSLIHWERRFLLAREFSRSRDLGDQRQDASNFAYYDPFLRKRLASAYANILRRVGRIFFGKRVYRILEIVHGLWNLPLRSQCCWKYVYYFNNHSVWIYDVERCFRVPAYDAVRRLRRKNRSRDQVLRAMIGAIIRLSFKCLCLFSIPNAFPRRKALSAAFHLAGRF